MGGENEYICGSSLCGVCVGGSDDNCELIGSKKTEVLIRDLRQILAPMYSDSVFCGESTVLLDVIYQDI